MMIQLIPVSDAKDLEIDLKQIYLDSFPANERRQWKEMQQLLVHPLFRIFKITESSTIMGLISFWKWPQFLFIEHFAVKETYRGQGIGTRIMKQIIKQNSCTIILEVEEPYTEQAKRRIAFYQNLGFILCPQEYYQPPYNPTNEKVKMIIMSYPELVDDKEFAIIKKQIYREVYKWDN